MNPRIHESSRAPTIWKARILWLLLPFGVLAAVGSLPQRGIGASGALEVRDPSTPEDRAALFDSLLAKTLRREAFSPIKNSKLGLDIEAEMRRYRDELIAADTDEKLYYALVKISNTRRDRHVTVELIPQGLTLPDTTGTTLGNYPVPGSVIPHAPIRFAVDYGTPGRYSLFVSDYATNIRDYAGETAPSVGDMVLAINGEAIDEYRTAIEPYHRYASINGFWWQFATWLPQKSHQFPPSFYRENVNFTLERDSGERYSLTLPYLPAGTIEWREPGKRRYPGFRLEFSTETFDFYRSATGKPVLLLAWYGFRENLVADMDRLMDYAEEHELLDHAVIFDGTRSRGGSNGAYAIRRLSPKSFRTTFGNLRISDVTPTFVETRRRRFDRQGPSTPARGEIDDGTWLLEWLESDVMEAMETQQPYSNNVPFKLAHLPKNSDGFIKPAEVHFRGRLVCFLGPYGGSHLDQFAAIVADNDLAHLLGMSTHGYSNTWEWEEILHFPLSGKPIVRYMWSIGHTIRPNGEVLEGNPAEVDELIPVTRDNYLSYYPMLVARALEHLGVQ